jgi:hypothetical protein
MNADNGVKYLIGLMYALRQSLYLPVLPYSDRIRSDYYENDQYEACDQT